MSDLPNVDEAVIAAKVLNDALGIDISGAEVGRLKAKSAKQAGDITKLIAEKANLKTEYESLRRDAFLKIEKLDHKIADYDIAFRRVKKERDEALPGGDGEITNGELREKVGNLETAIRRRDDRITKDADLITDLYRRINEANETAEQFKKAADEHNTKYWKLRNESLYGGDGEIADARAEYAELNKKLIRSQDVNCTLARNNAMLRKEIEKWGQTNRRNAGYNAELRQRLDQAENAVRDALQAITGDDDGGDELPS